MYPLETSMSPLTSLISLSIIATTVGIRFLSRLPHNPTSLPKQNDAEQSSEQDSETTNHDANSIEEDFPTRECLTLFSVPIETPKWDEEEKKYTCFIRDEDGNPLYLSPPEKLDVSEDSEETSLE